MIREFVVGLELTVFAELALVLFAVGFVLIAWRARSMNESETSHCARLPLIDSEETSLS